jgi:hypothetical protein
MYLEAMQDILPGVSQIYVLDDQQQNFLPLLDLARQRQGQQGQTGGRK